MFDFVVQTVNMLMFLYQKINMACMKSFNIFRNFLLLFFFSGLHRLSHHAAPGDLFPVTDELIINKEEEIAPKQRKRRAFRT